MGKLGTDCPTVGWQGELGRVGPRGSTGDSSSSRQYPGRCQEILQCSQGRPWQYPRPAQQPPPTPCRATRSPLSPSHPPGSSSTGVGSSQRAPETRRAGHPVSKLFPRLANLIAEGGKSRVGQGRRAERKGIGRHPGAGGGLACYQAGALLDRLEGAGSRAAGPPQGRPLGASWPGRGGEQAPGAAKGLRGHRAKR